MNNGYMPAMPCGIEKDGYHPGQRPECYGMTKREHYAGLAMLGLLSATNSDGDWAGVGENAAIEAVKMADSLLQELSK